MLFRSTESRCPLTVACEDDAAMHEEDPKMSDVEVCPLVMSSYDVMQ